ncbi:MAG TPA: 4'-phosphopantetheinyl transferase superfamily protein [Terriglobales bacterium]
MNLTVANSCGSADVRLTRFQFRICTALGLQQVHDAQVHLWHACPNGDDVDAEELLSLLSEDERHRMARFRFHGDRRDFAFARGMLRTVLASYLDCDPGEVRFSYSRHGKPALTGKHAESRLQFNLSHTAGYVLLAVCFDREVGVDVERLRADLDVESLAKRFFSAAEQDAMSRLRPGLRARAFFHCWTRKEAFLKAKGGGLMLPLEDFDVSLEPDEENIDLVTRPEAHEAEQWRILNVPVPEEYAAAVVVSAR